MNVFGKQVKKKKKYEQPCTLAFDNSLEGDGG
jgi:hypothetical protein